MKPHATNFVARATDFVAHAIDFVACGMLITTPVDFACIWASLSSVLSKLALYQTGLGNFRQILVISALFLCIASIAIASIELLSFRNIRTIVF